MRLIARTALRTVLARLRRLPGSERGFTMVAALGVMTITSVLVTATFVAAKGDINLTQRDLDNKRAYFAARGGVDEFLHHLKQNPNYWTDCPSVDPPAQLPGSTPGDDLTYGYVPVPANGAGACVDNDASTMIDDVTGTFRMQFTGTSSDSSRSMVASFRRDSPLDFLWYTIYEVLDPNTQPASEQQDYRDECEMFHREGRDEGCDIQFISADFVKGPMFTQDQFATCGSPTFGRDSSDEIKSMGNPVHYPSCAGTPNELGTLVPNAGLVDLPPANTALRDDAVANNGSGTALYSGPTRIEFLGGNTARVTNVDKGWTDVVVNLPSIVYVEANPPCSDPPYTPYNVSYSLNGGCGNVYVSGQYSQPITIAATRDIIIEGDVTASSLNGPAMLGLVAKDFVRVMHSNSCQGAGQELPNPTRIHAAILALEHSFIVDNYNCGAPLGTLEVRGAIAQNFRGTVGRHSGTTVTNGYVKDYEYDDRLATRMPPYLFDLNEASWHIDRLTICVLGGSDPLTQC